MFRSRGAMSDAPLDDEASSTRSCGSEASDVAEELRQTQRRAYHAARNVASARSRLTASIQTRLLLNSQRSVDKLSTTTVSVVERVVAVAARVHQATMKMHRQRLKQLEALHGTVSLHCAHMLMAAQWCEAAVDVAITGNTSGTALLAAAVGCHGHSTLPLQSPSASRLSAKFTLVPGFPCVEFIDRIGVQAVSKSPLGSVHLELEMLVV